MSRVRAYLFLILTGFFFATASCSLMVEKPTVSVNVDPQSFGAYLASKRTTYDCYFVSIDGAGISPDFGPLNLGARDPKCLGLGMTSPLLNYEQLTTTGTRIRITAGNARRVRIMGVNTSAPTCAGLPLATIFGTRRPSIFEIASATEDIKVDRKIVVNGSLSSASTDIVPACDNTDDNKSDSTAGLIATGTVLVFGTNGSASSFIRTLSIDDNLMPSLITDYQTQANMGAINLAVTPNGSAFFAVGRLFSRLILTVTQRYTSDGNGTFVTGEDFYQTYANAGTNLQFSAESKFAYFLNGSELQQNIIGTKTLNSLGAVPLCDLNFVTELDLTRNFMLFPGVASVRYLPFPTDGDLCILQQAISQARANPLIPARVTSKAHRNGLLYVIYDDLASRGSYYLAAYQPNEAGAWTTYLGDKALIPVQPINLYVDRVGKFVFVLAGTGGTLFAYKLNTDGSIARLAGQVLLPFTATDLAIEANSRAVYVRNNTHYATVKVSELGVLTNEGVPVGLAPPGISYSSIATIPLF